MTKTVREVADNYLISKQAVFSRLKKLPTDCYIVDDKGAYHITEKGLELLDDQLSTSRKTVHQDVVTAELQAQVSTLQQYIDTLLDTNKKLTTALQQEQQLHAIDKQKLLLLEQKSEKKWWQFWKKDKETTADA